MRTFALPLQISLCLGWLVAQSTDWKICIEAGEKAFLRGDYSEAEKQFRTAIAQVEKRGEQDPELVTSLKRLIFSLVGQGKHNEAEPVLRRLFGIQQKVLAADNPDIANSFNLLSLVTRDQRHEADQPDTATSLNNLAAVCRDLGKYADSESLFRRELAIREKALGQDNPDLANTLEGYVVLLRMTKRDAEAAKLEERARVIRARNAQNNPKP